MTPYLPTGTTPPLNCRTRKLDFSDGPKVMGILNTTPDSFHDGGTLTGPNGKLDLGLALERSRMMLRQGADIIDIGGESSRPGARVIGTDEEIQRTAPLIELLRSESDALISIDTYKAAVAEAALLAGADIVNDISGFSFDSAMPSICRRFDAAAVLMHTPARPADMQWSTRIPDSSDDITATIMHHLEEAVRRAESAGVQDIIIDPGFGFGKSVEENFRLLRRLGEFRSTKRPVLVGLSRKSFLAHIAAPEGELVRPTAERFSATLAAETLAILNGADIIRTHDAEAAKTCIRVVQATMGMRK
ncbi:MAG: dihydropteroate synthase [Pelodictyon luteolum]|uniref:Dihydropteroate synthase n=1 Tax=Pelodictyon luteolum TaxID=1100 RepID=A0A165L4B5_PELLU|nr:dihydropteroate synthase [Pelodictyon luteolum]KZK73556.1 MAG: dihydropteroate synthase [Pelodictyon luteolum]